MAKRLGDFNEGHSKKLRTDLDDLWGDDFDVHDVEECFQLATQICEQDITDTQQNVSVVPSYPVFKKQTKRMFTSTQSNPELTSNLNNTCTISSSFRPTNGINNNETNHLHRDNGFKRTHCHDNNLFELESKFRKVQDQCYAKEGEVSILRSQLKDIKVQSDKEHMKTVKEWSEKLETVTKQLTAVKSELEFKNYEIINLKQQVTDKIKVVNRDTTLTFTQSIFFKQNKDERFTQHLNDTVTIIEGPSETIKQNDCSKDNRLFCTTQSDFPLQESIESSIFHTPIEEKYATDMKNLRMFGNRMPFVRNDLSQELTERLIQLQPKRTLLPCGKELTVDYIQADIFNLMKCTSQELEMPHNYPYINKIVCTSEQLCDNLYKFFVELEKSLTNVNVEMVEMLHLKSNFDTRNETNSIFSPEDWLDGEMGRNARQSISCIAHILHNSSYLRKYLLENKRLIFKGDEDYLEYLPIAKTKYSNDYVNNYDYLNILLSIITISGKLRNSHNISGFLSAVCVLLDKVYICSIPQNILPLITKLSHELVFVCPNVEVLCYLSECFKNAVLHRELVTGLCKMGLKIDQKDKIVYYKQDVCVLQVFCILLGYSFTNEKLEKVFDLYSSVMVFIKNCFKLRLKWMHYQENKHCDCLCKIVKLGINVLYQVVEEFKKIWLEITNEKKDVYSSDKLSRYAEFLRNGIEVLEVFKYKVYNIIINYVITHSEYKVIIKSLISLKDALQLSDIQVDRLQDLTDIEETTTVKTDALTRSLWN